MSKFRWLSYLVLLLVVMGCKSVETIEKLRPGQSAVLDDFRHDDLTFACEVSRDASRVRVITSSSDRLFQDAWGDLESARSKYQMQRVKVSGKVFFISGGWHISMHVGDPLQDTEHPNEWYLVEAIVELENTPATLMGKTITVVGRVVFIELWNRIHIDNARILPQN